MSTIGPVNFASAVTLGSDYEGDYQTIETSSTASRPGGPQVARFFVTGAYTSGSDTGVLHVVLLDQDNVPVFSDTATLTITAVVAGSGRRVATVEFAKSGSDKLDLLGARTPASRSTTGNGGWKWAFAITDAGSFSGNVEVSGSITSEI